MPHIFVITGQTASGKTERAIELAQKGDGELINADSRQIYKDLDIITGKGLDLTTNKFHLLKTCDSFQVGRYTFAHSNTPIWLYDVVDPHMPFSAFDFRVCAQTVIDDILQRGKTPIIVGGTYFYLKHLLYGTVETFTPPNQDLRTQLNQKSVEELQLILEQNDPKIFHSLNHSDRHNPHRLIRRIEVVSFPKKNQKKIHTLADLYPDCSIKITGYFFKEKENLKTKIEQRVLARLENGAIEEVKKLVEKGYSSEDPGLRTIGYIQIMEYLNGKKTREEMRSEWITKEIQYAKRQYTFMKQNPDINWIATDEKSV